MSPDQLAVDAARLVIHASIAIKPIFSFATKLHLLRREPRSHGESGQSQTSALSLPKVAMPTSKPHQATSQHRLIWTINVHPAVVCILLVDLWMTLLKMHQASRYRQSI